ncbi:MAG: molybdate ABC transporter substrate-binding protein [Gammaproteobacteria bacterium]|nr:MAG: molybdate ABC transporter substrate-binding protein [Gammaproteobacteria bacterium]
MKRQKIMSGTKAALLIVLVVSIVQFAPCRVWAGGALTIAVAANFYRPMQEIVSAYEKRSGNRIRLVSGSTGKLYAQIIEGAPFDMFFAADRRSPVKLERKGLILPGSRFTYATGKLVAYTTRHDIDLVGHGLSILLDPGVRRIAIANPKTAPYGRAAMQALKSSGIYRKIKSKLVYGENIGQTFLFVRSQNADLGLVAASSTYHASGKAVPVSSAYDPIIQQAVTLRGASPASARFITFFAISAVHDVIRKYGYGLPQ